MVYHAMYFNLQWKGLVKCAIKFDVKKVNWNFVRNGCRKRWRPHFHVPALFVPLAVSSAQISASAFAVWLPEASVPRLLAWSPQKVWVHFFSTKQENTWSITAALQDLIIVEVFIICFIMLAWTVLCFEVKCLKVKLFCTHFRFINHLWTMKK